MAEETADAAEAAAPDLPPPRPSKAGVLLQGLNLLATLALLAVVVMQGQLFGGGATAAAAAPATADEEASDAGPAPEVEKEDNKPGPLLTLDDFVVRLRNPERERYLRMSMRIELEPDTELDPAAKLTPQVREVVLRHLSDRTFEDLRGARGLEECKAALTERLSPLFGGTLRAVYITNFVIQ